MPAIPLYTDPSYPDASHAVRAPGGYEWWTFDAEDAAGDTQLFVTLVEGHETDPGYLRAYARFRRRPTRVPPPVPRGYAFACFALYRGGRLAHRSITHRSEEHTSELQSLAYLVCRLLLEKKKN